MDFKFSRIGQALSSKELWKNIGWGAAGAVAGEALGAIVQGISGKDGKGGYNIDLSGIKGDIVTGSVVTAIGLGFNKPQVAIGTMTVKAMKGFYLYGNPLLAKTVGSPIPPSKKNDYMPLDAAMDKLNEAANSVSDEIYSNNTFTEPPAGMEFITAPDGVRRLVSSGKAGTTMNDYSNEPLADYSNEPLKDYSNIPLADFTSNPFNEYSLNDNMDLLNQYLN